MFNKEIYDKLHLLENITHKKMSKYSVIDKEYDKLHTLYKQILKEIDYMYLQRKIQIEEDLKKEFVVDYADLTEQFEALKH